MPVTGIQQMLEVSCHELELMNPAGHQFRLPHGPVHKRVPCTLVPDASDCISPHAQALRGACAAEQYPCIAQVNNQQTRLMWAAP
jgi:hypothetical protein